MKYPTSTRSAAVLFLAVALLSTPRRAAAQGDDFNDGNSDGWSEQAVLTQFGVAASFSFPDGNKYRMQSAPSVDEGNLGQARIGALREDVSYNDFYVSVDVVDYDTSLDQNIGILARVKEPGLGMLDGYGMTYNPIDQRIFFTVITDEGGPSPFNAVVPLAVGEPVRLVFQGKGSDFKLEVFTLNDLENAVALLEVSDGTYTTGTCGIFVVSDPANPAIGVDCTFDNYFAATEDPEEFRVLSVQLVGEQVVFEFLSKPSRGYALWISNDLATWAESNDGITGAIAATTVYTHTPSELEPAGLHQFYQFRRNN